MGFSQQSEILGDGNPDIRDRGGNGAEAFEMKEKEEMNDIVEKGSQTADVTKSAGDTIGVTRRHKKR